MTDAAPTPAPDLAAAHAVDPTLLERARANAARITSVLPRDLPPEAEPAHIYVADPTP